MDDTITLDTVMTVSDVLVMHPCIEYRRDDAALLHHLLGDGITVRECLRHPEVTAEDRLWFATHALPWGFVGPAVTAEVERAAREYCRRGGVTAATRQWVADWLLDRERCSAEAAWHGVGAAEAAYAEATAAYEYDPDEYAAEPVYRRILDAVQAAN